MASIRKFRNTYKRWLKQYERFGYREFIRALNRWSRAIKWGEMTEFNYREVIGASTSTLVVQETLNGVYFRIGMQHGLRVGNRINKELKEFTEDKFTPRFTNELNVYMNEFGLKKAKFISDTFKQRIISMLSTRLEQGMTIEQAQREVRKIVDNPSFNRAQALRIVRTETTSAANFAASQASTVSGFLMQKQWISTRDARTRRPPRDDFDHFHANGQKVPEKAPFNVSGEALMFPGDPNGSAGNIINCRCTMAIIPVRDKSGNLVPV